MIELLPHPEPCSGSKEFLFNNKDSYNEVLMWLLLVVKSFKLCS